MTQVLEHPPGMTLEPQRTLHAEDFVQPLWIVVRNYFFGYRECTKRVQIKWGEPGPIELPSIRSGWLCDVVIYDRQYGGDPVLHGRFSNRPGLLVAPRGIVVLSNFHWPRGRR